MHAQGLGETPAGLQCPLVAFEADERARETLGCAHGVGDRLKRMEGAETRARVDERVEREAIEQAGQVKHDLLGADGPIASQLCGDTADRVVRRRNQHEAGGPRYRRAAGSGPGRCSRCRPGPEPEANPPPIRPAPIMATGPSTEPTHGSPGPGLSSARAPPPGSR